MTESVVEIRQHELANWMRCRRKWHRLDLQRLELIVREKNGRDTGADIHAWLQWHYDPTGTVQRPADPDPEDKTAVTAKRVFEEYVEWLEETGEDAGFRVVAVEHTLYSPVIETPHGSARVGGKADMLVQDDLGNYLGVDHKSGVSFSSMEQLFMSSQLRTYSWLAEGDFEAPVRRWLHNQLRTVQRTPNSKPPYFKRTPQVPFSPALLENHGKHVRVAVREIMEARAALGEGEDHHVVVPPTLQPSCSWSCDFAKACGLLDEGREDVTELYQVREER